MSRALFFALCFCLFCTSTLVDAHYGNGGCQTREGLPGACQPLATCFYQYGDLQTLNANRCSLGSNTRGVCCPTRDYRPAGYVPFNLSQPEWPVINLPIEKGEITRAVAQTEAEIEAYIRMESNFIKQGYFQRPKSMASIHQSVFGPPDENLQALNLNGLRALEVTRALGSRFRLNPLEMRDGLSQFDLYDTPFARYCPAIPKCNPRDKYRTSDGSCNNLDNPLWGKSSTQYNRVLPPAYGDGISTFRRAVAGGPLPLARLLSTELSVTSSETDPNINVMFMQWGQFLDHDMTLTSSTRASDGQGLFCCNQTDLEEPVFHPACRPIIIPRGDPFYAKFNHRCMHFVRNAVGPKNNCNLGYREQTNTITAYLDASMVYGNQANRSRIVRTFRDGLLRVSRINKRDFLPYDTMNKHSDFCEVPTNVSLPGGAKPYCIYSEWSDETLYQEARRIVGAQIQHITYNEWLPLALGRSVMKATSTFLQPTGHFEGYNPRVNPSILNEFASATFRLHTLVQGFYQLLNAAGEQKDRFQMRNIFNNPSLLYRDGAIDETTYGLVAQKSEAFDPIFVDDMQNFLFPENGSFGMDLIAITIQRGRDHGMPSYNEIRRVCGLRPMRDFAQLNTILRPGMAEKFSQVYDHVDDIDLYVGGVNEIPLPEGILGPTFACIVAEQFRRLKYGDRFWYENGNMAHSFTEPQLQELRKVSLAGVICANGDRIKKMQPFAMLAKSGSNNNIDCKQIHQINLKLWKE